MQKGLKWHPFAFTILQLMCCASFIIVLPIIIGFDSKRYNVKPGPDKGGFCPKKKIGEYLYIHLSFYLLVCIALIK